MVAEVSSRTLSESVPRSGLASTAIPGRRAAKPACAEADGGRGLADAALEAQHGDPVVSACDRCPDPVDQVTAAHARGGLADPDSPPVARYTVRRQPPSGVARLPGSSRSEVSTSEVGRCVASSGGGGITACPSSAAGGAASAARPRFPGRLVVSGRAHLRPGTEGPRSGGASSGARGAAYGSATRPARVARFGCGGSRLRSGNEDRRRPSGGRPRCRSRSPAHGNRRSGVGISGQPGSGSASGSGNCSMAGISGSVSSITRSVPSVWAGEERVELRGLASLCCPRECHAHLVPWAAPTSHLICPCHAHDGTPPRPCLRLYPQAHRDCVAHRSTPAQ